MTKERKAKWTEVDGIQNGTRKSKGREAEMETKRRERRGNAQRMKK